MKFNLTFKRGIETVAVIEGTKEIPEDHMTVKDILGIQILEQTLEFLTGFRVHVQQK